jgi:hypothetical protein
MKQAIRIGLIGGVVEVLLALIGMIEAFSQRDIISHPVAPRRSVHGLPRSKTDTR